MFNFNEDIYICHTYIPPSSSKLLTYRDFDFYEEIEKGIEHFKNMGKTFIVGDLNSRTGQLSDILEFDKYLDIEEDFDDENIEYNKLLSPTQKVCPVRKNEDKVIDSYGRKLINLCKTTDHAIANGRLCSDQNGNFTFCSIRGLSVTDYLLTHKFNLDSLHSFQILDYSNFSDHAPIYFTFLRKPTAKQNKSSADVFEQKIVFNEEKIADYKNLFSQNLFSLDVCINSDINTGKKAEALTNFLYDNANKIFGKNIPVKSNKTKGSQTSKPKWFDKNCQKAKQEFKTARNIFSRNKTNENRLCFVRTRTKYNRIRQKAKRRFKMNEGKRLGSIANSKPRQFWKSLKQCYNKSQNNLNTIKMEDLYEHFNTLLSQNTDEIVYNQDFQIIEDIDLDCEITEHEVRKAVFKQKNGKSCGPDDISAEIIKVAYDIISPQLVSFFNKLFINAEYPENWSIGYLVPLLCPPIEDVGGILFCKCRSVGLSVGRSVCLSVGPPNVVRMITQERLVLGS